MSFNFSFYCFYFLITAHTIISFPSPLYFGNMFFFFLQIESVCIVMGFFIHSFFFLLTCNLLAYTPYGSNGRNGIDIYELLAAVLFFFN